MAGSLSVVAGGGKFWLATMNATIACFLTSFTMEVRRKGGGRVVVGGGGGEIFYVFDTDLSS